MNVDHQDLNRANLGRRIHEARKERGLSQGQIAEWLGITQSQVSKLERGEREASFADIGKLATRFGLPLQWFLDGNLQAPSNRLNLYQELRAYGLRDLNAQEPSPTLGAFRAVEAVLCHALSGRPDPRIVEGLPALLLLNRISAHLLLAFARERHAIRRTALIAEVARHFYDATSWSQHHRVKLDSIQIETFLQLARPAAESEPASPNPPDNSHPFWKRWQPDIEVTLEEFEQRAISLIQETKP